MTEPQNAPKSPPPNGAPFFIGYLPMPAALKRFYWPLAALLIAAAGALGYALAAQQKSTGPATWQTAAGITVEGVLTLAPYPALHRFKPDGAVESLLLVAQGKHSARPFAAEFAGRAVAVTGYEIRRGGWRMLEIAGKDAIAPAQTAATGLARLFEIKPLGRVSLRGEVVDSKCFLGVMKPGAGKVHKACAELCLLGGIPPMLVAKDANGAKFGYLIAQKDGAGASAEMAKFAADPVQIRGQLQQQGDLLFIAMDAGGIRRL